MNKPPNGHSIRDDVRDLFLEERDDSRELLDWLRVNWLSLPFDTKAGIRLDISQAATIGELPLRERDEWLAADHWPNEPEGRLG